MDLDRYTYMANKDSCTFTWRGHGDVRYSHSAYLSCNLSKTIVGGIQFSLNLGGSSSLYSDTSISSFKITGIQIYNGSALVWEGNGILDPALDYKSFSYAGQYSLTRNITYTYNIIKIELIFIGHSIGYDSDEVTYTFSDVKLNGYKLQFI